MRLLDTVKPTLSPWLLASAALVAVLVIMGAEARMKPLPKGALGEAETLYRHGVLPDGTPLRGERQGGEAVEGQAAACANCHRRSGFGVEEGRIVIPPINGKYLFREGSTDALAMAHPGTEAATPRRSRYNSETLARAIRDAMIEVLNHFFGNKNAYYRGADPPLQSERRIHFRVLRRWQLHVWELKGTPDTWEEQLERDFKVEPVFAVISGVGGRTWEPVHEFCEHQGIPCLMPNIDLPVVDEKAFYPVYYSRGVLLEADVMAQRLAAAAPAAAPGAPGESATRNEAPAPGATSRRIVQIFRPGDIGAAAARALATALVPSGAQVVLKELKAKSPARELAGLVREARSSDALILWLHPADLGALPERAALPATVLVSGLMGGLERAPLPSSWRGAARLTYPFALPSQRAIAMDYPLGWYRIQQIAVSDERTQTDTYLACSILAEAASTMLDNFVPDYLVERVEVELSHRIINGYYPRLGLAPGQRFASKGAYLVRFSEPTGTRIVADGDWVVP